MQMSIDVGIWPSKKGDFKYVPESSPETERGLRPR